VAFGLEWLLYDAVLLQISQVDTLQIIHLVPFTDLLVPMVATFSFAGLFVGVVGSLTSIRRFLNV
jgi:cell division protein FtsX